MRLSRLSRSPLLLLLLRLSTAVKLNGNRTVTGVLRGFDQFMNLVLDETQEMVSASEQNNVGMVVIRGNSLVMIEALEKLWGE